MSTTEPQVVAILRRNKQGILEEADLVELRKDEFTTVLATNLGTIIVVGTICAYDNQVLHQFLADIRVENVTSTK